jgi:hypothetical protein
LRDAQFASVVGGRLAADPRNVSAPHLDLPTLRPDNNPLEGLAALILYIA